MRVFVQVFVQVCAFVCVCVYVSGKLLQYEILGLGEQFELVCVDSRPKLGGCDSLETATAWHDILC